MKSRMLAAVAAALLATAPGGRAVAGFVFNIYQDGSNVVASGSGTIDLTDLVANGPQSGMSVIIPEYGVIVAGPATDVDVDTYTGFGGPAIFGPGYGTYASSGSGSLVGISFVDGIIVVPAGYVSGTQLSATSIWDDTTLSGLGLALGNYTWSWGSGAHADSLTLNVNAAGGTLPEPSSLVMAAMACLSGLILARRRRP